MGRAARLEYLHVVLKEFDTIVILGEDFLIKYFRDGLRLFICTQLDKCNRYLKLVNNLIPYFKKVIRATLKTIGRLRARNLKTKKTQRLKKHLIILALTIIVMMISCQASQVRRS